MIHSTNFPISSWTLEHYGDSQELRALLDELGLDGIEGIYDGVAIDPAFDPSLLTGYHLTFYPDWLDYYRGNIQALESKFGSYEAAAEFYGGADGKQRIMELFREDLERAIALHAQYVVFHVTDVSIEEGLTYVWQHSDEEVLDASIEVVNSLLEGVEPNFDFLVENQWWPGFTFTDPGKTARLLDEIDYQRKGIMLDTGHLLSTNRQLRTQAEAITYIEKILDIHGELAHMVKGMHLSQSLSGAYVDEFLATGAGERMELPDDYADRFAATYAHIQAIDRHEPWTDTQIKRVIERTDPLYITHELAGRTPAEKIGHIRTQMATLKDS